MGKKDKRQASKVVMDAVAKTSQKKRAREVVLKIFSSPWARLIENVRCCMNLYDFSSGTCKSYISIQIATMNGVVWKCMIF